jgi:hypothetical protein
MPYARFPLALTLVLVIVLLVGMTGQGQAQFVVYDDFSSGVIFPVKWYGSSIDGNSDGPSAEIIRRIEGGQLHLSVTSYGNNHSDSGTINNRVDLRLKDLGTAGGSGFITAIKTTVTVLAAKSQNCAANTGTGNVRAQIVGFFFNDGTGPAGMPLDRTGNIGAFINIQKQSDGAQQFVAGLFRCSDSGCGTTTAVGTNVTFTTTWAVNEPLNVNLTWKEGTGKFVFTAKGETHDFFYPVGLVNAGPPLNDFKGLRVSNFVENCNGVYKKGIMDALFDDVQVKRQP